MRRIATPSRLAQQVGKRVTGFDFELYHWLEYAEQRILDAIMDPRERFILLNVPPRSGKALAIDTPIPIPGGWKPIGEIRSGDHVYGPDGGIVKAIAHEPYEASTFMVTFSDGSSIECDGDHLWTVIEKQHAATWTKHRGAGWTDDWMLWQAPGKGAGGRGGSTKESSGKPRSGSTAMTLSTLELAERLRLGMVPRIPNGRIEGDDIDLPIDPYLLGYWLGDGTTLEPALTVGLSDIDHVVACSELAGVNVSVIIRDHRPSTANIRFLGMKSTFTQAGLLGNKHIPAVYLRASWKQRAELLAGLLDSDGGMSGSGCEIAQQNRLLASQIEELVCSLGGRVSTSERPAKLWGVPTGKTVWRLRITVCFNPFRLQRKADGWSQASAKSKWGARGQRIITSVVPTGRKALVRCLTVFNESGLYLAGPQMVPTHNTMFSGVFLPGWFLGMFPSKRVLFVTYSDDFSVKFGRAVRTILDRFGREYFGVGVDKSAQSASDWQMANSFGGMLSTGVGGVLTGYGGDLIIIDDIIKNVQEARSQTTKRMHEDWYDSTLRSRLHPGGTIIITATRWAEDDLSGVLVERMNKLGYSGDQWEVLDFPALAEPRDDEIVLDEEEWRDVLGRKIGEALNPERYTREQYETIKNGGMDGFLWSCLYQQRPSTPEGGMFPRSQWKYWNPQTIPSIGRKVRVWDLATTEGGGDWTVGTLIGLGSNGDLYVLDRQRFQRSTSDVENAVLATASADGYGVKVLIEQERAGAGKTVVQSYQRMLPGHHVEPAKAEGSKEQRATPYSAMQQRGRVWLPEFASWLEEWRKEHQGMMGDGRRPRHDDQIDTAAYGALELLGKGSVSMWVPGENDGWLTQRGIENRVFGTAASWR